MNTGISNILSSYYLIRSLPDNVIRLSTKYINIECIRESACFVDFREKKSAAFENTLFISKRSDKQFFGVVLNLRHKQTK